MKIRERSTDNVGLINCAIGMRKLTPLAEKRDVPIEELRIRNSSMGTFWSYVLVGAPLFRG